MISTLLVIAKEPVPGRVKTRLVPPFSFEQAAQLAGAALRDTLRAAGSAPVIRRVLVFSGDADSWAPAGWCVASQVAGTLDLRLAAAFRDHGAGPTVLVGMDTPQFQAAQLLDFSATHDACLGLAADGGFWAIGFTDPAVAASVITGVAMSTDATGAEQLRRMQAAGLRVLLLDELLDVDDAAAARTVAAAAPDTEFARQLAGTVC